MSKGKAPSRQLLKQTRHDLSILKKKGLWSGDARSAAGGWRQRALINKYRDVIEGKATVVKAPRKEAKKFSSELRVKGDRVVVPSKSKFHYDKKTKQLVGPVSIKYDRKVREIYINHPVTSLNDLPKAPKNKIYRYSVYFSANSQSPTWGTPQGLAEFMSQYEVKRPRIRNGKRAGYSEFKREDWLQVVKIDEVINPSRDDLRAAHDGLPLDDGGDDE